MAIFYLIGIPAVGKHTVAKAISSATGAIVVDNQLVNLPIFTAIGYDGSADFPFPVQAWRNILAIRQQVLHAIRAYGPADGSFVFTNCLDASDPEDPGHFDEIARLATERRDVFVPVWLTAAPDELRRRITNSDRRERLKISDVSAVDGYVNDFQPLVVAHPNAMHIDTTRATPAAVAERIVAEARRIEAGGSDR